MNTNKRLKRFKEFYKQIDGDNYFSEDPKVAEKMKDEDGYHYNHYSTYSIMSELEDAENSVLCMVNDMIDEGLITENHNGFEIVDYKEEIKEFKFVLNNDNFDKSLEAAYRSIKEKFNSKKINAHWTQIEESVQTIGTVEHHDKEVNLFAQNKSYVKLVFKIKYL